jgi:hypothetical protein
VTLASVGAPSWTSRSPVTDNECDAPGETVPAHTVCPVDGSVAITQHEAEASTTTVYGADGAVYFALNDVGAVGVMTVDATVVVGCDRLGVVMG